jgi:hypothetical protein
MNKPLHPGSGLRTSDSEILLPGSGLLAPDPYIPIPGSRLLASDFLIPGFSLPTPDPWFLASDPLTGVG